MEPYVADSPSEFDNGISQSAISMESQSSAGPLRRGRVPPSFSGPRKKGGGQSADKRRCESVAPVASLAVQPIYGSPEMTGRLRRPARLSAPCCGIYGLRTALPPAIRSGLQRALRAGGPSAARAGPEAAPVAG